MKRVNGQWNGFVDGAKRRPWHPEMDIQPAPIGAPASAPAGPITDDPNFVAITKQLKDLEKRLKVGDPVARRLLARIIVGTFTEPGELNDLVQHIAMHKNRRDSGYNWRERFRVLNPDKSEDAEIIEQGVTHVCVSCPPEDGYGANLFDLTAADAEILDCVCAWYRLDELEPNELEADEEDQDVQE